jgi:hypothetical protein
MGKTMNWSKARYAGKATELAAPKTGDEMFVIIRCRKCGHMGQVRRYVAERRRLSCTECGWRGERPRATNHRRSNVRLSPDSGEKADIPQPPLRADSVEKVESNAAAKTSLKLT